MKECCKDFDTQMYHDKFHNAAMIKKYKVLPYYGATVWKDCYRLSVYSLYDENFMYHVSTFESLQEALDDLKKLSCGEWERVE